MPYIERSNGLVVGVFQCQQHPDQAFLPSGHPDVLALLQRRQRRSRTLSAIYQAIQALRAADQNAIWADLTSGAPPKWTTDEGPHAGAILALHFLATNAGLSAAASADAKRHLMALFVQDNPAYLVHPPFAASIDIPGDEPE